MQAAIILTAGKRSVRAALRQWIVLLRAPNIFTVPGDILAGYLLAGPVSGGVFSSHLLLLIGTSILLYSGGVILNDWFDLERDRIERPERPLPAGQISPGLALTVAVLLFGAALALAAAAGRGPLTVAVTILVLALFYNGAARRIPILGFMTMGLCRGANLILGASDNLTALPVIVLIAGAVEICYVAAVTAAASRETKDRPRTPVRFAPLFLLAGGLIFLAGHVQTVAAGIAASAAVTLYVFFAVISMRRDMPVAKMPVKIGVLIRALIPLQAAFILICAPGATMSAAFVYGLWPLSSLVGRRIRGS